MTMSIFQSGAHIIIAERIKNHLNQSPDFMSAHTLQSTRAMGDAIQEIIGNSFNDLAAEYCVEYSNDFSRRAMEDLAFTDKSGYYHCVDIKTHRADTDFNMPNVTSVERLSRFYEDDKNHFSLLMVKYTLEGGTLEVTEVIFELIEHLGWDCLTIGALGWGQIQISNSNKITIDNNSTRKNWMIKLCDTLLKFYPKEISKIDKRIKRFEAVKLTWTQK